MIANMLTRQLTVYVKDNKNPIISPNDTLTLLGTFKCALWNSLSVTNEFPREVYPLDTTYFMVEGGNEFPRINQVVEFDGLKYKINTIKTQNKYANVIKQGAVIGCVRYD